MSRRIWLLLPLLVASVLLADEKIKMSFKEYKKRNRNATKEEAYERALGRLAKAKLGMRSQQFFTQMEMLYLKDDDGKPVDGFIEGHLRKESVQRSKGKAPDHYIVFGWYKKPDDEKGPVEKFHVVFRGQVLREILFYDPKDDVHGLSGKIGQ